jgi:hypothetical protein
VIAQRNGPQPGPAHAEQLTREVEREWRALTAQPLRFVAGDAELANGVASYAADRPRALPSIVRPSEAALAQDGVVIVCFAEDNGCQLAAARDFPRLAQVRATQIELRRDFLGFTGQPRRYTIQILSGKN